MSWNNKIREGANTLDTLRLFPRFFIATYIYLFYDVVQWFMVLENPNKNKKISSIVIITHSSKDQSLNKILKQVARKKYIYRKPKLIRINNY